MPAASPPLACSFCAKPHAECAKLIAGHNNVAICDECIEVCHKIGERPGVTSVTEEYARDSKEGTQEAVPLGDPNYPR